MSAAPKTPNQLGESQLNRSFRTAQAHGYAPANNNKRVIAFFIDIIVSSVLSTLLFKYGFAPFVKYAGSPALQLAFTLMLTWLLIPSLYWVVLQKELGATPGKKMMGLKVVNLDGTHEISYGRLFVRDIIGRYISSAVLFLGYVWVIFNKDRRSWHDLMSKTRVVDFR